MHPLEQRPRQGGAEPALDEMGQGTEAEWAKADPPYTLVRLPALELDRRPLGTGAVAAQGKQHTHALIAQPPNCEFQLGKRRCVEPLNVVKRNDRRERRERSERRVQFNFPSDQLARHARSIAPPRKKRHGWAPAG